MGEKVVIAANVYVSRGDLCGWRKLDRQLKPWEKVLHQSAVATFSDVRYNRSSATFVGRAETVLRTIVHFASSIAPELSLRSHSGTHPRIGVLDNIVLSPIDKGQLEQVAELSESLAEQLSLAIPNSRCLVYSSSTFPLSEVRRKTSYFWPNSKQGSAYAGALCWDNTNSIEGLKAFGRSTADPDVGLTCVGATHWVTNYNVPLNTSDVSHAKHIARAIRERTGGEHALKAVQAVGLEAGDGRVEVACNLLDWEATGPEQVQARVEMLTDKAMRGYVIGKSWHDIVELGRKAM